MRGFAIFYPSFTLHNSICRIILHKLIQLPADALANGCSEKWTPSEDRADAAKRHTRPLPHIECIVMPDDLSVAKIKSRLDHIMHWSAVFSKQIRCLPIGRT